MLTIFPLIILESMYLIICFIESFCLGIVQGGIRMTKEMSFKKTIRDQPGIRKQRMNMKK